ncbi:MAG: hypothetical protein AB8B66_03905 [Rickettsiaceae bacterium]
MTYKNKIKILQKLTCACIISLSAASSTLASKTEDFTGVISFGDSFVSRPNSYAQTLTEQLGFAFERGETNFGHGRHGSANMVGGDFPVFSNPAHSVPYASDLDGYIAAKGRFGPNELIIYDPLSSEVANTYDPLSREIGGMRNLGVGFVADVFANGLAAFTGNPADMSDLDTLTASGQVVDLNDLQDKVVDGSLEINAANFPVLFGYLGLTENNTQNFVTQATLNGANYIVLSNHYNEALRQALLLNDDFSGILSQKMAEAQIRGASKVSGANIIV